MQVFTTLIVQILIQIHYIKEKNHSKRNCRLITLYNHNNILIVEFAIKPKYRTTNRCTDSR